MKVMSGLKYLHLIEYIDNLNDFHAPFLIV